MRLHFTSTRKLRVTGLVLTFLLPVLVLAQDTPSLPVQFNTGTATAGATVPPALLKVFNRPIIVLRATVFDHTPADRVAAINQRFDELVAGGKTKSLTTQPSPEGTIINLDGELLMLIATGDVDPFSGGTMESLVQGTTQRLQVALDLMREQHSIGYLLRACGSTLVATLLYVGLIWSGRRLKIWLWTLIGHWRKAVSKSLGSTGRSVVPQLQVFYQWTVRVAYWILVIAATDIWLSFSLRQFPYTAPWGEVLGHHLIAMLRSLGVGVIASLPDVFVAAVIVVATHVLTKVVRMFFANVREGRINIGWLDPASAKPTGRIVQMIMWAFAMVMMYPYLPGSGSAAFRGVGVFVGLLVSLGGTGLVSQVMGGFVLMYTHSLKAGEYVRMGEHEGTVEHIGFLSTRLRTRRNEMINIPNALLMGTTTTNYSRLAATEGVMASTTVTIGYDAPWRQVHAMLLRAANKTAGIKKPPEPFVWQRALSDFYVEYELNVSLEDPEQRLPVLSVLCANIQDEFNEHGVQILSPHFMANPPDKVWVPKEKWHEPPATRE
jgi:small-conductance mechanosensitive channel